MNIVKLTDVCDFQGGTQPPKSDWIKDPKSGYIRMLQIRDFTQRERNNIEYVKEKATLKTCDESDILIGRYGASIGKICSGLKGAYNVALVKTIPNKNLLNKDFLLYALKGEDFQNFIQNIGSRAAQAGFNKADLEGFQFPLPSLPQQQKIANILDAADALRQNDKALIAKYDELTQALFLDMFGDPVSNPKGWEMMKLEGFCEFENGDRSSNYPSGDDIKSSGKLFLSSGDIKKGRFIVKDSKFISQEKYNSLKRGKCYRNDVLMTLRGNGTGKSAIFDCEYEEGFINAQMVIIRPNDKCEPNYLVLQLNNPVVFKRLISFNSGSAQPQLSAQAVKEFKVFVPPVELQNQFAERVAVIEEQKAIAQKSLEKSESLFNSLLQKAFKGELV